MAEVSEVSASDDIEENVLYDLTIAAEWPQEPETINRNVKEKSQVSLTGRLTSAAYRSLWTFLRSFGISMRTASPCILPAELVRLVNSHINWHLEVSHDGRHLAVLQDQLLEIRSSRDEYNSVVGRGVLPTDPYPQWRTVAWSRAGDMVACSGSAGDVVVLDVMGNIVVSIPSRVVPNPNSPVDLSHAVVALIFKEYKSKDDIWQEELLVINYQGAMHSYLVSMQGTFCMNHKYNFSGHYPRGLSSAIYLSGHDLLVLGGVASPSEGQDSGPLSPTDCGLSLWRCLSDYPHYKLVTDYDQDMRMNQTNLMSRLRNLKFVSLNWRRNGQDGVFRMSCSQDGKLLVAVHYGGTVSLWHVPSLRLVATWPLEEQPGYDEVNPEILDNPRLKKQMKDSLKAFHLMDINWWSEEAIILVRGTGALSVSSVKTLRNLLGTSPEWFAPAPVVSPAIDGGFMALECEAKLSSVKRRLVEGEEGDYEDSDDELDTTMVTKSTRYVKWVLHYVTDIERFQPPRKRPKVVNKTYRLISLKSTTPEELYHRKIDHEEYGEALALAKVYGLDCDLVYQRQWRKTPVSVASIQDYLSKISKRSWVLNDCMERVPENIDAMRELLQYGLRGTDLEALLAIGRGEDGGRFIFCDNSTAYEESLEYLDDEALEEAKEQEAERRQALADTVDWGALSLEQRELCRARVRLLQYLDRLSTYEEVLGGIHAAEDRFDPKFFEEFRAQNIVELAVNYARQCDWRALEVLFTYHGAQLLHHRLAILSNFPETFAPGEYRSLLPEAGWRPEDPDVLAWEEGMWRRQDWVEMDECRAAIDPNPQDPGAFLYEEDAELGKFRGDCLTREQLSAWYQQRACQTERQSRQVDHALELVRYGMERNVQDLERLCDDLITMETLVYECYVDDDVLFEDLQAMDDIDKLRLIMSTSSDEMYMKNVRRWMVPFLQRCEKHSPPGTFLKLVREYLVTLAKDDLARCCKVFESSKADQPNPVISSDKELISMALECIYACESNDQLSNAFGILECLPQRGFGVVSEASSKLHNQVDELECHLSAAETLERHGLPQTIASIRDTQNDVEEARKLFTKLTRFAGRKTPPLTSSQWKDLLLAMLDLRDKVYQCIQSDVCYEIFVESLLCSSRPENIQLAGEMMERSMAEASEPDYPSGDRDDMPLLHKVAYSVSVDLVLAAAQEYFNSSAALTDNCMELARMCLNLISDKPAVITEELDLIESLALLAGFGVSMLPLQVRMTSRRLDLIQKAIDAKPFTYKNSQRLLRLARLLRVKGNNERDREGEVLKLVAQAALKAKDHRVAYDTCQRLVECGYAPVWEECKALTQEEGFTDTKAKVELLSFAVAHCSEDMVEPILRAKCYLETQILYERLQASGAGDSGGTSPTRETSPFSARAAIQQTQEILSATTSTTRTVLSAVSDRRWWQRTMSSLHPASQNSYTEEWDDRNVNATRQGCHPFYGDVVEGGYLNNAEADYRGLRRRPTFINGLNFSEAVLHLGSLEQTLTEGGTHNSATAVLLQLAEDVILQDSCLGLAYLLALPEPLDANPVFKKLPRTVMSLQLATYYYALQIGSRLVPEAERHQGALYTHDPSQLITAMLAATEDGPKELQKICKDLPKDTVGLIEKLHHYHELMTDFTQAQVLENLSKGVDVARFTQDNDYKRETILGLAMTTEQAVYETALSLAKRYKLPLWELYMTHMEHLFDCGLPTAQLEERVVQQGLMHALSAQPEELAKRMAQFVYPTIAGTDHGRLLYYYSLLDTAKAVVKGVPPDTHIRLLKKIRPAAPGLDYKNLMDGTRRPLEVIRPILNDGNVHVLAKLAPKIPDQKGGFLQPSLVFCAWAVKMFWGNESRDKDHPQTKADWIHRYESCGEYIQKLSPDDVVQFIEAIIFVPQALDQLGLECRQDIVRRAIKFCKQGGKKKRRDDNLRSEASWEEVAARMQQSLDHLTHLDNPVIAKLSESDEPRHHQYARLLDLSRSEPEKVHEVCVQMVLDAQPWSLVTEVLSVVPDDTWQPQTAVREAITLVVAAIRTPEDVPPLLEGRDLMKTLEAIVHQVHDDQDNSDLVSVDDVMTLLRPFCADVTVPVQPRLDVLHTLEQAFELNEADLTLLICYRTDAIISTGWVDRKVTEAEVGTDEGRLKLFDSLLASSSRLDQFTALTKLLNVWPPLNAFEQTPEEPEKHPWCQVMVAMVTHCKEEAVPDLLKTMGDLKETRPLSVKCVQYLFDQLVESGMWLAGVKSALISGHTELHDQVLHQLSNQETATDDPALCRLILQHHLVARIVTTPYYPLVADYVISQQTPGDETPYYLSVETIANQLQELGHVAEAGSLLMTYRGTHPMLRTFDMTFGVLAKWFNR